MKKLLLLALVALGGVMNVSADDPTFLGNGAINVNGTWYYAEQYLDWCTGGGFNGNDLGVITTLAIGGKSEAYDRGQNWNSGTVTMGYKIDGGSDYTIGLNYCGFQNNNNIFQSGGSNFVLTEIDFSGLTCGEHSIEVWFQCGSKWDSHDGKNFKAKFTIADTYTRDVTSGNFGTICLPFAATVTGATVFKIVSKVEENGALKAINLESVESLEAGHAYIFKATSNTLTATLSGEATSTASDEDGMQGNLSATPASVASDNYVVYNNQVCPVGSDVTVGQYRAYITLSRIGAAASRGANFIGFDEATGIDNIKAENGQEVVYNLQGQRVTDAQKGLVIMGGKKMLRK